jgi:hypothetical protein
VLDGQDPVEGDRRPVHDRAARLEGKARDRQPERGAFVTDHAADPVRELSQVEILVSRYVRNRVAAAQVELGEREAMPLPHVGHEPDQPARGDLERRQVRDLRSEMAM